MGCLRPVACRSLFRSFGLVVLRAAFVGPLCLARLLGASGRKLLAVRGLGLGWAGPVEGFSPARGWAAFLPRLGVPPLVKPFDSH